MLLSYNFAIRDHDNRRDVLRSIHLNVTILIGNMMTLKYKLASMFFGVLILLRYLFIGVK